MTMRRSAPLLLAGLALLLGAAASAANPDPIFKLPPAEPGAVLTVAVPLPVRSDAGTARYVVTASPHVRIFGAASGTFQVVPGEAGVVPLTLALARDQESGPLTVASIAVQWPNGTLWSTEVLTDVVVRRRMQVRADSERRVVAPGRSFDVRYVVQNRGNSADSISLGVTAPAGWRVTGTPAARLVARGDSLHGALQVTPPRNAGRHSHTVTVHARGLSEAALANAFVDVSDDAEGASRFTAMPMTIFTGVRDAGDARDPAGLDVAIRGDAALNAHTLVAFAWRAEREGGTVPAFAASSGFANQASIRTRNLDIRAGELMPHGDALGLSTPRATGATTRWKNGSWNTSLQLGRPVAAFQDAAGGHILGASAGVQTGAGAFTVNIEDIDEPFFFGGGSRFSRRATLAYALDAGAHRLFADAGWLAAGREGGDDLSGFGIDGQYRYSSGRRFLSAQVRRVPGMMPLAAGAQDQVGLSFATPVIGRLSITGFGQAQERDGIAGNRLGARTASSGILYSGRRLSTSIRGDWQQRDGESYFSDFEQHSATGSAAIRLGFLQLQGSSTLGVIYGGGGDRPMSSWSAQALASGRFGNLHLVTRYDDGAYGEVPWSVSAGGDLQLGPIELAGGVSRYLGEFSDRSPTMWWGGATLNAGHFSLIAGADARPWDPETKVRFSLGVKTRLRLPVPALPSASITGVVFDDLNSNGLRDDDEPGLPGVPVRLGNAQSITDVHGRFRFVDARERTQPSADIEALGPGYMVAPFSDDSRQRNIAVVRVMRLSISALEGEDGDSDGLRPAARLRFTLLDAQGRLRSGVTGDEGLFAFSALPPGTYTLTAFPVNSNGADMAPRIVPVVINHGSDASLDLIIPSRSPQIRFRNGPPIGG
jgi:hypothetical protein